MPNIVKNIVEADEEVIASMLNEKGLVDFNCILPMPEKLEDSSPKKGYFSAEVAAQSVCNKRNHSLPEDIHPAVDVLNLNDKSFEQFVTFIQNKRLYDYYHSVDFALDLWGVQWNAIGQVSGKNTTNKVYFETTWNHPTPVIEALSKKFSEHEIKVRYANECADHGCRHYLIKDGVRTNQPLTHSNPTISLHGEPIYTKEEFATELEREFDE